jgi:sortase (surface protein transpeptidase)
MIGLGFLLVGIGVWAHQGTVSANQVVEEIAWAPQRVDMFDHQRVAMPYEVRIPSLGVRARVQSVGKTETGLMSVPSGISQFRDVAWYREGVVPGMEGNAVVAGHVSGYLGVDAVFADLHHLTQGATVLVVDTDSVPRRFIVTRVARYPATETPIAAIFGETDGSRLNLITCAGEWNPVTRDYTERIVVYTVLDSAA